MQRFASQWSPAFLRKPALLSMAPNPSISLWIPRVWLAALVLWHLQEFYYLVSSLFQTLSFIHLKNFYWCIVALQCYVRFCCTAKWIGYTYIYSHSFQISILHIVSIVYMSTPVSQFIPYPPSRLGVHTFVFYVCVFTSALQIGSSIPFF